MVQTANFKPVNQHNKLDSHVVTAEPRVAGRSHTHRCCSSGVPICIIAKQWTTIADCFLLCTSTKSETVTKNIKEHNINNAVKQYEKSNGDITVPEWQNTEIFAIFEMQLMVIFTFVNYTTAPWWKLHLGCIQTPQ